MSLYCIKLNWKKFKVHLPDAEDYFKMAAGSIYVGNSASGQELSLWFTEDPSENVRLIIEAFWDGLSEGAEAKKISHSDSLKKAEEFAKENIINVDFSNMIIAEKKIFMGRALSKEDRESLLIKYPNF